MVEVVAAQDLHSAVPTENAPESAAAGPRSPLDLLRSRRSELKAELHLDLAVPRWEADGRQLWVRYGPCSPAVFSGAAEKRQREWRRGEPEWMLRANADMLVDACIAIYDLPVGEEPPAGDLPTLSDPYPTFSTEALSESVGAPRNAAETCVQTYLTEGDLLMAANQLLEFSGKASKRITEDFLGS